MLRLRRYQLVQLVQGTRSRFFKTIGRCPVLAFLARLMVDGIGHLRSPLTHNSLCAGVAGVSRADEPTNLLGFSTRAFTFVCDVLPLIIHQYHSSIIHHPRLTFNLQADGLMGLMGCCLLERLLACLLAWAVSNDPGQMRQYDSTVNHTS